MKSIFSILIAFILVLSLLFDMGIADNTGNNLPNKIRYDLETGKIEEGIKFSKTEAYVTRTSNGGFSPEYSVDTKVNTEKISPVNPTNTFNKIYPATSDKYRTTVFIELKAANGSYYRGTGFLIGPSAVVTAAHNIYNEKYGGEKFVVSGTVSPARSDSWSPYGSTKIKSIVLYDSWLKENNQDYDIAILELNRNIGDSVGWIGLRYQEGTYDGTKISINGYPRYVDDKEVRTMYSTDGTISKSHTNSLRSNDTVTKGGMSGAPVYINSKVSGYTAIGIHRANVTLSNGETQNKFVRITEEIFNDLIYYRNIRV